jgi:hypothetical protein
MNKVTLKLNRQIQKAINQSLAVLDDVEHIEYQLDWSNFPNSLRLNCILENTFNHTLAPNHKDYPLHLKKIQQCFLKQGIKFNDFRQNLQFSFAK